MSLLEAVFTDLVIKLLKALQEAQPITAGQKLLAMVGDIVRTFTCPTTGKAYFGQVSKVSRPFRTLLPQTGRKPAAAAIVAEELII